MRLLLLLLLSGNRTLNPGPSALKADTLPLSLWGGSSGYVCKHVFMCECGCVWCEYVHVCDCICWRSCVLQMYTHSEWNIIVAMITASFELLLFWNKCVAFNFHDNWVSTTRYPPKWMIVAWVGVPTVLLVWILVYAWITWEEMVSGLSTWKSFLDSADQGRDSWRAFISVKGTISTYSPLTSGRSDSWRDF